jgi:hypothetical protein
VELAPVLPILFFKMLFIDLFKISKIKGAFGINAFMYAEESPIPFGYRRMTTVRTYKAFWGSNEIAGNEGLPADLIQVLATSPLLSYKQWCGASQRGQIVSSG